MYEQGLRQTIFADYWVQKAEVVASAGKEACEGVVFASVDLNQPKFQAEFNKRYHEAG